jgi:hypothetical protein
MVTRSVMQRRGARAGLLAMAAALPLVVGAVGFTPPASAAAISTTSTAGVNPTSVTYGADVTYSITVTAAGGNPTGGGVNFQTGSTELCTADLGATGTASCLAANAPAGTDQVLAIYDGFATWSGSSGTTTLTVNVTPPTPPSNATSTTSAAGTNQTGSVSATLGNLIVQANGPGAITLSTYGANPTPLEPVGATGVFDDVALGTGSGFSSVLIADCNYGAGSSLQWYDSATASWVEFSAQEKQVSCLFGAVTATTSPSLSQLAGTPIAVSWLTSPSAPQGYWLAARDGGIFSFNRTFYGSTGNIVLNQPIVGMATTHDDAGYWLVARDGGIFSFGDAVFEGSLPSEGVSTSGVVGIVSDPVTNGYAIIRSDGSVWDFNTPQFGDLPLFGFHVNNIVGGALTPDGKGLYLVGADGRVYSLAGDSVFQGDASGSRLNAPIVGMAVDPATSGYWLVGADGGVFSFNAPYFGSTGNLKLNQPIVAMSSAGDGGGYWFTASDGGVFSFGDALFWGSTGNIRLNQPVVAMAGS